MAEIEAERRLAEKHEGRAIRPSRISRMYPQTAGAIRVHQFFERYPQFRDLCFVVYEGRRVIIFAASAPEKLYCACQEYDLELRVGADESGRRSFTDRIAATPSRAIDRKR